MVRTACGDDPPSAYTRPIGALEEGAKGPMPKQRKRRARSPRKVSSAKQPSGLIVTANRPTQSAGTKSALDNRSHRTTDWLRVARELLAPRLVFLVNASGSL